MIVIGAGFAGACAAFLLRERFGASVTVIESSSKPGGMLRTLHTEDGLAYEYGPRVLSVFRGTPQGLDFVRRFLDLRERDIYQGTRLLPDYPVIPFPVDLESLKLLPVGEKIRDELAHVRGTEPDETNLRTYLETTVGPTLTTLVFEGFNRKFWGRDIDDLPASWGKLRRLGLIAESGSYRLPSVAPHYYPAGGFNSLFDQLLDGIDVRYRTKVRSIQRGASGPVVHCDTCSMSAEVVVSTAPIDELLAFEFGALEWKGYRIEVDRASDVANGFAPDGIPFAWLYTPWEGTPVCRTTDFGVIHDGKERPATSVVLREIPDDQVRMYPVSWEEQKFSRYLDAISRIDGVIPLGRLGLYKYVTVDSTFAMVDRMLAVLPDYQAGDSDARLAALRNIRGDWQN